MSTMGLDSSHKKRILILSANPRDSYQLRLGEEVREIRSALRRAEEGSQFDLQERSAVRANDLIMELIDIKLNIVHFSGHGVGARGLVFEDDTGNAKLVNSEALANVFELCKAHVECVVLNACYSEEQAREIVRHINYVVGMSRDIEDRAAIKFSNTFYYALGSGKSIRDAYYWGCSSIEIEGFKDKAVPTLLNKDDEIKRRDLESKLAICNNQIESEPNDEKLWKKKARLLKKLGRIQEAVDSYEKASKIAPNDSGIRSEQGTTLAKSGKYAEAVVVYDKALNLKSEDYQVWWKKGMALANLGEYAAATESYDKALQLEPPPPDCYVIYTERGFILGKLNQCKLGIDSYNAALKIEPRYRAAAYDKRQMYRKIHSLKSLTF